MNKVIIKGVKYKLTEKLTLELSRDIWDLVAQGKSKSEACRIMGIAKIRYFCPCCEFTTDCAQCPLLELWEKGFYHSDIFVVPKYACVNYTKSPYNLWTSLLWQVEDPEGMEGDNNVKGIEYAKQIRDYAANLLKEKYQI